MTTDTLEARVAKRFALDIADHKVKILQERGMYRHIRFMAPKSSHHWFDLITWPGSLTIKGDMGSYTFSRTKDMLDFFRRSSWDKGPNLSYWEEKLDAVDASSGVREYSVELFRQLMAEDVDAWGADDLFGRMRKKAVELGVTDDRLPKSVVKDCKRESDAYLAGLREELDAELLGEDASWYIEDEGEALSAARQFEYRPDGAPYTEQPFTFDTTEWNVRDYSWHYVWCCHAIIWGITQYDAVNGPERALLASWLKSHGDYDDWAADTHRDYEQALADLRAGRELAGAA
jgi:hypothetical protein